MNQDQSYYLPLEIEESNVCRNDLNLVINCVGLCVLPQKFTNKTILGREDYYLQYLCKGEMDVWIEGELTTMQSGQAILYYPKTCYHYTMHGSGEVQYYWVHFTGYEAKKLVDEVNIQNQTVLNIGSSVAITLLFEQIFKEFIIRDHCFEMSIAAKLTTVFVELSRRNVAEDVNYITNSRIHHALSHIHKNYNQPLVIKELAQEVHLSNSRFRTVFKNLTGLSPMEYLTTLRINHARQLMPLTALSICEIASRVGYDDQLYFSRIFKKKTGVTPRDYRKNL